MQSMFMNQFSKSCFSYVFVFIYVVYQFKITCIPQEFLITSLVNCSKIKQRSQFIMKIIFFLCILGVVILLYHFINFLKIMVKIGKYFLLSLVQKLDGIRGPLICNIKVV